MLRCKADDLHIATRLCEHRSPIRLLAFERGSGAQRLLCVFNFSAWTREWGPEEAEVWQVIGQVGDVEQWRLGPFTGMIAERPT